jgi:hypothetical protein
MDLTVANGLMSAAFSSTHNSWPTVRLTICSFHEQTIAAR